jgi:di/tripeptidase
MDMVCEKRPDVEHDFRKDPVISWRDGDWLRAKGTSLGADNAIALALFFDLATDPEAEHPKLEILVTADEETGLVGAQNLEAGFLTGTVLMNLDSEDEGVFTIGCAGGMDTNLNLPVVTEPVPAIRDSSVGSRRSGRRSFRDRDTCRQGERQCPDAQRLERDTRSGSRGEGGRTSGGDGP